MRVGLKTLKVTDRFLTPQYYIKLGFSGKGVNKSYSIVPKLMKKVFGIASKDWAEPSFKWDITDKVMRSFYVEWKADFKPALKTKDRWTKGQLNVTMQGEFNSQTGEGSFTLIIIPSLIVEFVYANSLQRMLYEIYMRMFYAEQRRKYVEYSKMKMNEFIDELKSIYGKTLKEIGG